jgi:hypothetical protein
MRRREFIALISGAAAWPWPARAQQLQHARVGWFTVAPHLPSERHLSCFPGSCAGCRL